MILRQVPPNAIRIPEHRVTARFDDEMWEQFKGSIREVGAVAPIICIEVDNELVLVDGLHRLVEAQKNGAEQIDVAVIPGDEIDVLTKNLFLDHVRGKPPVSEMVGLIKVLTEEYKLDSEAIAKRTGLTRAYVEKLQELSQLTLACLASLDEGKIGVGQAYELTRIADPIVQETVLYQTELYHFKIPALRDFINDVLAIKKQQSEPPAPGQPPQQYLIECAYCHEKFPIGEVANPHTCQGCAGILFAAIAQAKAEAKAAAKASEKPEG